MSDDNDEFLDDLFLGCAFAAYVDQAVDEKGPPDSEATRKRAYAYYEQQLAEQSQPPHEPRTDSRFDTTRRTRYQGTK